MDTKLLSDFGNAKMPSVINDPFRKKCIVGISVNFYQSTFGSGKWNAIGTLSFKDGNTNGEQKFKGGSFDEIVNQMKAVINNL